jgi:adenosylcobinamide-phosphate synthase
MSFLAVLIALLIEQLRPMPRDSWLVHAICRWVAWVGLHLDAGKPHHGWVVWTVSVGVPTLLTALTFLALTQFSLVAGLLLNVVVLYITLGFRQFSHHFTAIRDALDQGNEDLARQLLAQWRHLDASELPRTELLRHVIEHSLLAAHRHVFGVFFWFVVLSAVGLGPTGAVLYRMAELVRRHFAYRPASLDAPLNPGLKARVAQAFSWLDHIPARLTAFGFAVVGNFEEAIASWRRDSGLWRHANEGAILAAAAGAVGVQLGGRAPRGATPERPGPYDGAEPDESVAAEGSTAGLPPQLAHLQSMVGLVWRSLILWMLLLALLSLARGVG